MYGFDVAAFERRRDLLARLRNTFPWLYRATTTVRRYPQTYKYIARVHWITATRSWTIKTRESFSFETIFRSIVELHVLYTFINNRRRVSRINRFFPTRWLRRRKFCSSLRSQHRKCSALVLPNVSSFRVNVHTVSYYSDVRYLRRRHFDQNCITNYYLRKYASK